MKVKRILSLILSLTLMLTGILSVSFAESEEPEGGLESDTSLSVIMEDEAEIEFVADEPEDEPLRTAASDNDEEDSTDIDDEEDEDIDDGEDEDIPDIEDDEEDFDEPEEDEPEKPEEEPSGGPVTSLDDPEDLIHQNRREAHGGLVQHHQPGFAHQSPGHGQHLLFAA